jgi:rhodanese-related sulfurtransferase
MVFMRASLVCLILSLSILLAACANAPATTPTAEQAPPLTGAATTAPNEAVYRAMSVDEFASILDSADNPYTVVNVHIPYEGEVANTDMKVAYNDMAALTSALPDKNAPIILYCRSGRMSDIATRALVEQGYTQVWDVTGGMNAWTASGRELLFTE